MGGRRKLRSLYRKPVQGSVRGTYVIAPQQGRTLENSRRCLITCIIKVGGKGGGEHAASR